ncbi:MAG: hypothetical protein U0703_12800 [Anaerolineae bacterium]
MIVGPSLDGVATRADSRVAGMSAGEYFRTSILDPGAFVVPGFPDAMARNLGRDPRRPADQRHHRLPGDAEVTTREPAYRFFVQTLALLIVYALVSLIAGLKFLPGDLTQTSLPFNQVSALAAALCSTSPCSAGCSAAASMRCARLR